MKKKLLFLLFFPLLFLAKPASASHYMGGEITWTCTAQGNFRFVMKVYRECGGINFGATVTMTTNVPGYQSISMTRISVTDMSPVCSCPGGPNLTCATAGGVSNTGRVEEHIYTSDASYPNGVPLTGVPPVSGWYFGYTSCCRNPCTNITSASSLSWFLRAWMYPYNNTNVSTCFDNSPQFEERPSTVICTGYPYEYNHVASDPELDSLVYSWDTPLNAGVNAPITQFAAGYTFSSPLPGTMQNPNNVPATVDPVTGVISFTSYTNGAFVTVTKVTAYKCGIKVAEIFREMQVVLLACGQNNPPNVTPPFPNSQGQYTNYSTTVYAGQHVTFSISATDFEYCPGATPPVAQTMKLFAVGSQFGAPINPAGPLNPAGCLNPPCASLTPTPTFTTPISGQFGVQTTFSWQTTCDHLATNIGCGATSNVYNFLFKAMDNFCPAPGIRYATVSITVLTKPTLPSPPIHCLEVHPNGDVTLMWNPVKDTMNTFNSYHLWIYDNASTSFITLDSIFDIDSTVYTHVGAAAHLAPVQYFLTVRSGCNGTEMGDPHDTVSTIFLLAVNPGPAFGGMDLTWNAPRTPLLPSTHPEYEVWRRFPNSAWHLAGTTTGTTYFDEVTLCESYLQYKILLADTLLQDSTGHFICHSVSNISGDSIFDVIPPLIPDIHVVTIDPTDNSVKISWNVNQHEDVIGYEVFTFTGGVYTPLATIMGRFDTSYVDTKHDPCAQVIHYAVTAFDSCDNFSNFSLVHNTLLLDVKQTDCVEEFVLNWNAYNNMTPALAGYNIYGNLNGGAPTLVATVGPTVTTYTHTGLNMGDEHGYIIQAYGTNQSMTSECCMVSSTVSMPAPPDHLYIKTATVEDNSHITVVLHTDPSVAVSEYRLYRSNDGVAWSQIATLPMSANVEIEYNDYNAVFSKQSYYYVASVYDSCGYFADSSNVVRTILLDISTSQPQMINTLVWNDYEGFDGDPTTFNVWRIVDGVQETMPVQVYPPATGNHLDDVGNFPKSYGRFTYYVEALEGPGNTYGLTATSLSNQVQALMEPKLFIPSAFTPKGNVQENATFKPRGVFVPEGNYEFKIFNRLGQLIFSTTDIEEGWDGTFKGELVQEGVYVYVAKFISATKKEFERRGTVTLIR